MAVSPQASGLLLALALFCLVLLLVALALLILTIRLHHENEAKAHKWRQLEQSWTPQVAQVLIGGWPAEQLHRLIQPADGMFFVDFLARHASRVSGEARVRLQALAEPWLSRLAERCEDGDDEQRARAIFTLSALAPETYRPRIARALNDPVPMVAMLAARSLAEQGAHEYLDLLLDRLERFDDWSPQTLSSLLTKIASADPTPLRQALQSQKHSLRARIEILRALLALEDRAAVPLALDILTQASEPELEAAALDLLGRLGDASQLSLLRQKCRDRDFVIRLHALKALIQRGDASDEALFVELLDDDSHWIALQAALGLRERGCVDVLESLAGSGHARAELARQVLAEFEADKSLQLAAQSSGFARRVPDWVRELTLQPAGAAWNEFVDILLDHRTHPEVKLAMADALSPEAATWLYPLLRPQLERPSESEQAYLYRALHRLDPLGTNELLRQHFGSVSSDASRLEILDRLLEHHTPATSDFVRNLKAELGSALTAFPPELSWMMVQKVKTFETAQALSS